MRSPLPRRLGASTVLPMAVLAVIATVVLLAAFTFSWCVVMGRDPGPAGEHLIELVRIVLGAGFNPPWP